MLKITITILTLFSSAFLSLKLAGEYNFLWKYELDIIYDIIASKFESIHLFGDYFPLTILLSFIGQLFLISSLFINKNNIIRIGLVFLWLGLFNLFVRSGSYILFFTLLRSILFIPFSIWLYWLTKDRSNNSKMYN